MYISHTRDTAIVLQEIACAWSVQWRRQGKGGGGLSLSPPIACAQKMWIEIRDFHKVFSSILQVGLSGVSECQRQLLLTAMSLYGRGPVLVNDNNNQLGL